MLGLPLPGAELEERSGPTDEERGAWHARRTGPLRLGCDVASHIHIARATHATHAAATAALVVLGQFGHHRVGREHQSRD
jgi:hypothetical protein